MGMICSFAQSFTGTAGILPAPFGRCHVRCVKWEKRDHCIKTLLFSLPPLRQIKCNVEAGRMPAIPVVPVKHERHGLSLHFSVKIFNHGIQCANFGSARWPLLTPLMALCEVPAELFQNAGCPRIVNGISG